MLITKEFVMLNFPKTGSSFARKVIADIHRRRESSLRAALGRLRLIERSVFEKYSPKIDEDRHYNARDQHGNFRQIPAKYRGRKLVTITRNPFARYVSLYLYKWWQRFPSAAVEELRAAFPSYPSLSFGEYYEMVHSFGLKNRLRGIEPQTDLGYHTVQFVQFYFPDPARTLERIDAEYIASKAYARAMPEITFLRQERLNQDLKDFLLQCGYTQAEVAVLDHAEQVNVTERRKNEEDFRSFYTPELIETILRRDALLFDLFPEYLPENAFDTPGPAAHGAVRATA